MNRPDQPHAPVREIEPACCSNAKCYDKESAGQAPQPRQGEQQGERCHSNQDAGLVPARIGLCQLEGIDGRVAASRMHAGHQRELAQRDDQRKPKGESAQHRLGDEIGDIS